MTWRPERGTRRHRAPTTNLKAFYEEEEPGHILPRGQHNMGISSGGFKVGGAEARPQGALWWRHHTQPTVIKTFCQAYDTATEGYVPETTLRLTWQKEKMQRGVHDTQLWKHERWEDKAGNKSWAITSWHRLHFFIFTPHFSAFTINKLQSLPLWKFHTFPFDKMLGSW